MSRHDGVSCDGCDQPSFRGRRFKCLRCYDFDLCGVCYDSRNFRSEHTGHAGSDHTADHPMQCILTMADMRQYFGAEITSTEAGAVSFTCPLCGTLGYSESALTSHCISEHPDSSCGDVQVICPVCAANPRGVPNMQTKTLASHLKFEHSQMPNPDENGLRARETARRGRGIGGAAKSASSRRNLLSGNSSAASSGSGWAIPGDPISELLNQLTSVRSRPTAAAQVSSQLAQLEYQLQNTRAQLERLPVLGNSSLGNHISIFNSRSQATAERRILAAQLSSTVAKEATKEILAKEAAAGNPKAQTEPEFTEQPLPGVALNKDCYPLLSKVVDESTVSSTPDVVDRASYLSYLLIGSFLNPLTHLAAE